MKRAPLIALLAIAAGCSGTAAVTVHGGHVSAGPGWIRAYGCGACHSIPSVAGADGEVGPPLGDFSRRTNIAGRLPNTPENLVRWIEEPQAVDPGNLMPNLDVSDQAARDIAAYLYAH
jgi:cytochrome c1